MMTENKRFTVKTVVEDCIFDNRDCKYYDELDMTIALLNELNDENEQLKKRNNELISGVHFFHDEKKRLVNIYIEKIKEVEKENEQLKQRVSELECLLELDKLHKEVEEGKTDKFVELKLND